MPWITLAYIVLAFVFLQLADRDPQFQSGIIAPVTMSEIQVRAVLFRRTSAADSALPSEGRVQAPRRTCCHPP
jgi:hypothetical protein